LCFYTWSLIRANSETTMIHLVPSQFNTLASHSLEWTAETTSSTETLLRAAQIDTMGCTTGTTHQAAQWITHTVAYGTAALVDMEDFTMQHHPPYCKGVRQSNSWPRSLRVCGSVMRRLGSCGVLPEIIGDMMIQAGAHLVVLEQADSRSMVRLPLNTSTIRIVLNVSWGFAFVACMTKSWRFSSRCPSDYTARMGFHDQRWLHSCSCGPPVDGLEHTW